MSKIQIEVTERTFACLTRIECFNNLWNDLASESSLTDEAHGCLSKVMDMLFDDLRESILNKGAQE